MTQDGLLAVFDENRSKLIRYLIAHGAGDAAEDCVQELWIRIATAKTGPVAAPIAYLYRAATNLMIDRHRAANHSREREHEWSSIADRQSISVSEDPPIDQQIASRQQLELVARALARLPHRAADIFKRNRIDGQSQRYIASELSLSVSTIESDLRQAYRVLTNVRQQLDEG